MELYCYSRRAAHGFVSFHKKQFRWEIEKQYASGFVDKGLRVQLYSESNLKGDKSTVLNAIFLSLSLIWDKCISR